MKKILLILLISLGLFSCATTEQFEKNMNSWVGLKEIQLIREWGAPTSSFNSGSSKFLVYLNSYKSKDSYSTSYSKYSSSTTNWGGNTYTCEMTFEISNKIIRNVRWKGNNCRS